MRVKSINENQKQCRDMKITKVIYLLKEEIKKFEIEYERYKASRR